MSSIVLQASVVATSNERTQAQGDFPARLCPGRFGPWQTWAFLSVLSHYICTSTQQGREGPHFTDESGEARVAGHCPRSCSSHPALNQCCHLRASSHSSSPPRDLEPPLPGFPCGVRGGGATRVPWPGGSSSPPSLWASAFLSVKQGRWAGRAGR